jgi:hypothetical protein
VQFRRYPERGWNAGITHRSRLMTSQGPFSRLQLRAQHQALDLVGAAFDLVGIVGEADIWAGLQHVCFVPIGELGRLPIEGPCRCRLVRLSIL